MKKLISLSIASIMLIGCLCSCGDKDESSKESKNSYVGKWEASKMIVDDETITDMYGIPVSVMYQFEFKEGGKGSLNVEMDEELGDTEVTWSDKGDNKVEISVDGEPLEFELINDELVAEQEEGDSKMVLHLAKVDKFTEFDLDSLE